jgi:hypothetical protein
MTDYQRYGVNLSAGQAKKIISAHKNGTGCIIRLSNSDLHGSFKLPLTQMQINKIKIAHGGVEIKLSETQLKHMKKTGGFIPLLTLIPLIAGAVGAAGGLTGGIASAVSAAKSTAEQERHNRAIEEQIKVGSGIISDAAEHVPIVGRTLSAVLKRIGLGGCGCKNLVGLKVGNGLYLEPQGSGLFLKPRG